MNKRKRRGFTLIELLVVMSVIAILAGTVIVNMQGARDRAKTTETIAFSRAIQLQLAANAVGLWNFDTIQQPGNRVLDSSRARNHGTINLGTTGNTSIAAAHVPSVAGLGSALSFDGVDDFVNIPLQVAPGTPHTILFWVKFSDPAIQNQTLSAQGFWHLGIHYNFIGNGAIRFHTANTPTTLLFGDYAWAGDTDWHLIGGIYDGSQVHIIFDGVIYTPTQLTVSAGDPSNAEFEIARCVDAGPGFHNFNGLIDEVGIYNRALTAGEIRQKYVQGLNRFLANRSITKKEFNQRMRISQSHTKNNNQDTITKWDTRNNNQ